MKKSGPFCLTRVLIPLSRSHSIFFPQIVVEISSYLAQQLLVLTIRSQPRKSMTIFIEMKRVLKVVISLFSFSLCYY